MKISIFIFLFCLALIAGTIFQGDYVPNETALRGQAVEDFGTYKIQLGQEPSQVVAIKDNLYPVAADANGELVYGMRAIPVDDVQDGSQDMDKLLRKVLYGSEDAKGDIFAPISYWHPETYQSPFDKLADSSALRTEQGVTHMGAYIGNGETRNSPVNYHNKRWEVGGYPAHVSAVSLKGVDQTVLNKNLNITMRILNETNGGPSFPPDYKFDHFLTYNLEEVFAFYRAWIDPTYVRTDLNEKLIKNGLSIDPNTPFIKLLKENAAFKTYCAEHVTIAINAGLNIPQTEEGYQKIWGKEIGKDLFQKANALWKGITNSDLPQEELKAFQKPLWSRRIKISDGKPAIESPAIKIPGNGLAWMPETTFDIVSDFIDQYANFTKVSVPRATIALVGFTPEVEKRLGISKENYFKILAPVLEKMMKHDLMLLSAKKGLKGAPKEIKKAVAAEYFKAIRGAFTGFFTGDKAALLPFLESIMAKVEPIAPALLDNPANLDGFKKDRLTLEGLRINLPKDLSKLTPEEIAWLRFRVDLGKKNINISRPAEKAKLVSIEDIARSLPVKSDIPTQIGKNEKYVQYYSPPAVLARVADGGTHADMRDPDVLITTVATAFKKSELAKRESLVPDDTSIIANKIKEWGGKGVKFGRIYNEGCVRVFGSLD